MFLNEVLVPQSRFVCFTASFYNGECVFCKERDKSTDILNNRAYFETRSHCPLISDDPLMIVRTICETVEKIVLLIYLMIRFLEVIVDRRLIFVQNCSLNMI